MGRKNFSPLSYHLCHRRGFVAIVSALHFTHARFVQVMSYQCGLFPTWKTGACKRIQILVGILSASSYGRATGCYLYRWPEQPRNAYHSSFWAPHMAANPSSSTRDCEKDCKEIHDAWGRLNQLGQALAHRSRMELKQIRQTSAAMYGEDLAHRLQRAHATNPKNEICYPLALWVMEPHERDAVVARDAIEKGDTKYKALVEIYTGRKSSQLLLAQQAYHARFKSNLDQDISTTDSPSPYQKILVALGTSHKSHHADVSQHVAKCDAKRLFEAGEGRIGAIDESLVLEILSKRSIPQIKRTFSCYKHIYGHDYTKSLKKETAREFEDSLRTAVKCMYTPSKYYAKMLHACVKGMTADKSALARVIVSRAEIDMDEIQEVFHRKYGMKLHDAICESIPKGEYRDFLLALATT